MARTPKLPRGVTLFRDSNGVNDLWRVRLGVKFLGKGCSPIKRAFQTHAGALGWINEEEERLHPHRDDADASGLSTHVIAEIRVALSKLAGRATLVEAADAWEKYVAQAGESKTVVDAITALHADQTGQGLSARHVRETKAKLTRFFRGLEKTKVCDLKSEELEAARDAEDATGKSPSPEQRAKRLRYASLFIEFCLAKKWLKPAGNPLVGVSRPRIRAKKISCLSVEEVARLLLAAKEHRPDTLAALAIKVFAGVRNEELFHLTWEAFKATTLRIEKTKTDRARSSTIAEVLRAWIKIPEEKTALIFSVRPEVKDREAVWLESIAEIEKKAGVSIPQNGLRHTFGSFYYAKCKDASETSFQMGNSLRMVRDHYADAVDDEDAEVFWNLAPANAEAAASGPVKARPKNAKMQKTEKKWDWTDSAPPGHVKLYSVKDTVYRLGVFRILLDPGDNTQESIVTQEDWDVGEFSTVRARLGVLQRRGWIQPKKGLSK